MREDLHNNRKRLRFRRILILIIAAFVIIGGVVFAVLNNLHHDLYQGLSGERKVPDLGFAYFEKELNKPPPRDIVNYIEEGGRFELPLRGATGWAAAATPLRPEPNYIRSLVITLRSGQAFTILEERGEWWYIEIPYPATTGWIHNRGAFINLPDILPSMIFNISNAESAVLRSAGISIPNVTGRRLYNARAFNERLGRYEFIVPSMFETALKIAAAQQAALADGNTIVVYEVYRPFAAQQAIVNNVRYLMYENEAVYAAINTPPWHLSWFISTSLSNHQRGAAIDASLARVVSQATRFVGDFRYTEVTEFERFAMPTAMHELSNRAVVFAWGVDPNSPAAWRDVPLAPTMTNGARLMQGYFGENGMTPLASEWWHFTDLEGARIGASLGIGGGFFTSTVYSVAP